MTGHMRHIPVLITEVLEALALEPNHHVIDGTLGDAGHSEAILERTAPNGALLGIDADPESLLRAKQNLYRFGDRVRYSRGNFADMKKIAETEQFGPVNGILLDLGWSSPQFAERGRGFSFEKDEPLDMRYNPDFVGGAQLTAATIVNSYSTDELAQVFKQLGEEPLSREIAQAIVAKRKETLLKTTKDLVDVILTVYRAKLKSTKEIPWIGGIHPATRVFQALRIAANRELEVLKEVLPQAIDILAPGGRLVVITFHSLEDRIVKHFFQKEALTKKVKMVNKKPLVASEAEVSSNPRARSAKLRAVEKV
ncbi:MAG: 16S rRNA (cytosine(1402)-N(4))-methyltransferase [Candidatus Magasanikbacteria bacterium RIFCSPLOWO2_02_FULL_44_11]|uniref:Ribosomal RNA small subunit methyltransferase H n=2 Tax=Candidatus Magasanikiibacteriota TaxID=1752731 RepID=A0A1F6NA99_9BACT|nr:MAG: 16S rRNA (cytosine(1402)-N(4))-methyltransferase [Candidatus Magasanikbacteria bacterium RIFCSPHIGHO2_02_FULL_45_10]OGH80827.1 MAG: 16S rRNA (cytosine(1402)-N(4))-methyltransferase [Candidatus Magasanikbacteria bacterium RIFCSPLOWO2_02_FULL_44_11]